jgi:hypothetical protein
MKNKLLKAIIINLIIIWGISLGNADKKSYKRPDIKVAIALERHSFKFNEPLRVVITLENQGGEKIMPADFNKQDFHLMLVFRNPNGQGVIANELYYPAPEPSPSLVRIIAGVLMQVEPVEKIDKGWILTKNIPDAHAYYKLDSDGIWSVKAIISTRTYPGVDLTEEGVSYSKIASFDWSGDLVSNTEQFYLVGHDEEDILKKRQNR